MSRCNWRQLTLLKQNAQTVSPLEVSFGECTPPRRSTRLLKRSQWQITRATFVTLRIESLSRTLGHDGKVSGSTSAHGKSWASLRLRNCDSELKANQSWLMNLWKGDRES